MPTKHDRLNDVVNELLSMHSNNLDAIFGIGSYFHEGLEQELTGKERTIDLILIVNDLDSFYNNHQFEIPEYSKQESRDNFKGINEQSVVYLHQLKSNYRITVIPADKFKEWTSSKSPIGYFLRGRLQKPLEEILIRSEAKEQISEQLKTIRKEAVDHAFKSTYEPVTIGTLLRNLVKLSYLSEGLRGFWEADINKKHMTILSSQFKKLKEIYVPLIEEYIKLKDIKFDGKKYYPKTSFFEAMKFKKKMLNQQVFYARVIANLRGTYPDPKDFYVRKVLRGIKKPESEVLYTIASWTWPIAIYLVKKKIKQEVEPL